MQSVQRRVALVFGVDGDGAVGHDGLRARGRYGQVGAGLLHDFVANVVELGLNILVQNFLIAQRGLRLGVPMNHALSAVDVALCVEVDKYFQDACAARFVHGKGGAVPIAGGAQGFELLQNDAAVFVRPLPSMLQEGLAAEIRLFDPGFAQLLHHLGFRGDGRMVCPGDPASVVAAHSGTSDQDILNGIVEHMPHVQDAGNVGRRDDNGVSGSLIGRGTEGISIHPTRIPKSLYQAGSIFRGNFHMPQR